MAARAHIVEPGECISSIAFANGFLDWRTVWLAEENGALRQARQNPNLLAPGDKVMVPDRILGDQAAETGRKHVFRVRTSGCRIRIVLIDELGSARAGIPYRLEVGGEIHQADTAGDGSLEHRVPAAISSGTLSVGSDTWLVRFGDLDPLDDPRAYLQRLVNLGYDCDPSASTETVNAAVVRRFQHDEGLPISGVLDPRTRTRISERHGC